MKINNRLKKVTSNTTLRLLSAVVLGVLIGYVADENAMKVILPIKYVVGQIVFF